jgi:Fe-S-cluster-containing hydrogenase component 2
MTLSKTIQVTPSKCIGCINCEFACASRDWDKWFPSPTKINLIFFSDGAKIPVTCFQCDNAPCLEVCQTGALSRDDRGIITSNPARCVGCRACAAVCPFGNITYSQTGQRIVKCDQCDGEPRCAAACPSGALKYVNEEAELKERRNAFAKALKKAAEII